MATDEDTPTGHTGGTGRTGHTGHPVPAGVRALAAGVTGLAERPLFALDPATTRETILELADLRSRLAAYELSVLAHAEHAQVGAETGATSTGAWWAVATRQRRTTTTAQVRLGVALETRWHRVHDALASAAMNPEQTRVVITALEDLPEDLDHDLVARAEETLVGYATVHDPVELTTLGAHILAVIAPEVGDALDKKRLDDAERRAGQQGRTAGPDSNAGSPCPSTPTAPPTAGSRSPRPRQNAAQAAPRVRLPRPPHHHPPRQENRRPRPAERGVRGG